LGDSGFEPNSRHKENKSMPGDELKGSGQTLFLVKVYSSFYLFI
jgi:hypothetical protein